MKTIKGILITPNDKNTKPRVYELEYNSYKDFYSVLKCGTFDIQCRSFNGKYLDIYCDDEGLFKENNITSIVTIDNNGDVVEQIVGNVFICSHNDEGDSISLTDDEIVAVLSTTHKVVITSPANGKQVVTTVCIVEL